MLKNIREKTPNCLEDLETASFVSLDNVMPELADYDVIELFHQKKA